MHLCLRFAKLIRVNDAAGTRLKTGLTSRTHRHHRTGNRRRCYKKAHYAPPKQALVPCTTEGRRGPGEDTQPGRLGDLRPPLSWWRSDPSVAVLTSARGDMEESVFLNCAAWPPSPTSTTVWVSSGCPVAITMSSCCSSLPQFRKTGGCIVRGQQNDGRQNFGSSVEIALMGGGRIGIGKRKPAGPMTDSFFRARRLLKIPSMRILTPRRRRR